MRKAATMRNTKLTLSGKTPMQLAMRRRPRDVMDPAAMSPEELTSTPIEQDLLNEKIQKVGYEGNISMSNNEKTFAETLLKEWNLSAPIFRVEERVFYWQEDSEQNFSKNENLENGWRWMEIIAVTGPWLLSILVHFSGKRNQAKETCGHSGSGRTFGFVWANRSTCAVAFLWGPNGCLGAVLRQFSSECHPWSTRTQPQ